MVQPYFSMGKGIPLFKEYPFYLSVTYKLIFNILYPEYLGWEILRFRFNYWVIISKRSMNHRVNSRISLNRGTCSTGCSLT